LYFTYVSSVAAIRQSSTRLQASYLRGDLAPTLSAPFSPWTWLDITPTVSVRSTYWSQQQAPVTNTLDPVNVIDEGLWRNLMSAGVDIRGPKLVRIFETKPKPGKDGADPTPPRKYKNTIEPNVAYTYQQAFDRDNAVIVYDEVDHFGVNANAVTYGLSTRLIAQRPRAAAEREGKTGEKILIADGESGKLREAPSAVPENSDVAPADSSTDIAPGTGKPAEDAKKAPLEPIEIASLELSQSYSFNSTPSIADVDGNCIAYDTPALDCNASSHYQAPTLTARYNPSRNTSLNLTGRYDILFQAISDVSVSGNYRNAYAQTLFSVVRHSGLGFTRAIDPATGLPYPADPVTGRHPLDNAKGETQIRFQGNFGPIAGRVRLGVDGTYNATPRAGEIKLPYRRFRLEYYTQCCGFLTEYLVSQYSAFPRREFRFAVDLRGIGKLFDFNQANQ
jgi:hypothetical protein